MRLHIAMPKQSSVMTARNTAYALNRAVISRAGTVISQNSMTKESST